MFTRQNPFQPASRVGKAHYHPSRNQSLSKKEKKTVCELTHLMSLSFFLFFLFLSHLKHVCHFVVFFAEFESWTFKTAVQSTVTHSKSREQTSVWEKSPAFDCHGWRTCLCRVLALHWMWILSCQHFSIIWHGDAQTLCNSGKIHSFHRARSSAGFSAGTVYFRFLYSNHTLTHEKAHTQRYLPGGCGSG